MNVCHLERGEKERKKRKEEELVFSISLSSTLLLSDIIAVLHLHAVTLPSGSYFCPLHHCQPALILHVSLCIYDSTDLKCVHQ